ncbi:MULTISPECIES: manganese catalase family protein [Larkinella]|jgi:Mn-containing catalase|uniref:Manganese catalase family protein n=3 Tax=Larkinella TaxID=332157 RepID=A0A5N1JA47_9BACT|nr:MULTISPECIES: manganese catalase family protein [Larkinella]KAA9349275.1 manganese catalase family protein [Larkinella humicola]RCR70590.1 manganese catalase family protein [Larkinella punicea]
MILKMDRLPIELPTPSNPSPNDAAAVQELLGGKFGEMSTLMNYTYQSFNFRGRKKIRPFYDVISSIAGEEYGHIEVVAYTVNLLLTGASKRGFDPTTAPLADAVNARNTHHFIASGQAALPMDSMGHFWTGDNVFSSGNLKLDLLHNFFLECGARANKMRVYEMVSDPTARTMIGYLLVRGGLHVVAYAKALEKLTGVEVTKLLPIPNLSNNAFPEAKKFMENKLHLKLYTFSKEDYQTAGLIWNGTHPDDGQEVEVVFGSPEGFPAPDLEAEPQLNAPGDDEIDPEMFADMAKKMGIKL